MCNVLGKRSYYIIFEFSIFQCFYFPILNKLMNTDENGKTKAYENEN